MTSENLPNVGRARGGFAGRAAQLLEQAASVSSAEVRARAGVGFAVLALADAVGRLAPSAVLRPRHDDDLVDPTHTTPITVHGIPAEDHHAHVCPVCRRVREEKP